MAVDPKSKETRKRLEKCWNLELNWDLFPNDLKKGCFQVGEALCIPPVSVLGGLIIITSYTLSPTVVKVPGTEWTERALIWMSINMPTGSTKSALFQYLQNIIMQIRQKHKYKSHDPVWLLGDATCEKMGDLMASNGNRLLGLYDELSTFLSQLNLYRGKGLALSHELALFLQLYNGCSWTRNTVTGDANFSMESTSLTIGGFSQPSVARALIEQSGSTEIGLSQRILWVFPQPAYSRFDTLKPVDKVFTDNLVKLLQTMWIESKSKYKAPEARIFSIKENSEMFVKYFDLMQENLETLASMDDLLSGMLSKSKGQVLRISAALHVLFYVKSDIIQPDYEDETIPKETQTDASTEITRVKISADITEEAIAAAINFVELCNQQTAFMAGRQDIKEEIQIAKASLNETSSEDILDSECSRARYCLKLPGKRLNLSALLYAKKFRAHGYKVGAIAAFKELEKAGLGVIEESKSKSGTVNYIFIKNDMPDNTDEKKELGKKLQQYNTSLQEFNESLNRDEIQSPTGKSATKRKITDTPTKKTKSPRKQL